MTTVKHLAAILLVAAIWSTAAARMAAAEDKEGLDTPTLTNAYRAGWLQFGIASGRVTLSGSRGINVTTSSGVRSNDRRERLAVRMSGGDPMVDYEYVAPNQELAIEMSSRNRLHLRRKPKGEAKLVPLDFEQPAQGLLTLRVGPKDQQQVYRYPSIWHFLIVESAVSQEHLVPLLKLLNRDWDLMKTAADVDILLQVAAKDTSSPNKQRWAEWVQQLADPRFSKREAADRQLREAGRIVVTYLQQLEPPRLDAEQQYRIRRIIAGLSDNDGSDTPDQIASWLSGDPVVWLAMLSREDESLRRLSAKQLSALLGGPIVFDPAADRPTRAKQIEQLRSRVAQAR